MNNLVKRSALAACTVLALAGWAHNVTNTGSGDNALTLAGSASAEAGIMQPQRQTNERGFIVKQLGN